MSTGIKNFHKKTCFLTSTGFREVFASPGCGGVGTLEPYLHVHVKENALVAYGGMVNT
jgi:hypothetical protein